MNDGIEAWLARGVEPGNACATHLLVAFDPTAGAAGAALAETGNNAYEGDDAFFLLPTDAWATHSDEALSLWISGRTAPIAVIPHREGPTPSTVLAARWRGSREAVEAALHAGEDLPLVIGVLDA